MEGNMSSQTPPPAAAPAAFTPGTVIREAGLQNAEQLGPLYEIMKGAQVVHATDIHVVQIKNAPGRAKVYFCSGGQMSPAKGWRDLTDEKGNLLDKVDYGTIRNVFFADGTSINSSVVYRFVDRSYFFGQQIRATMLPSLGGESLILRIQPISAPKISETLKAAPELISLLNNSKGLVLVCGPQGAGKSTLAASIVEMWAEQCRHVGTVEDPVEYQITPQNGHVSHIETSLTDRAAFASVLERLLRGNLHALYMGELRTSYSLLEAMNRAGANEPVIATYHAGSITDAIIRMLTQGGEYLKDDVVVRNLAQCLAVLIYVDLAYTQEGKPVPVITSLPFNDTMRARLSTGKREDILRAMEIAKQNANGLKGFITRQAAAEAAKKAGATQVSIDAALPRD